MTGAAESVARDELEAQVAAWRGFVSRRDSVAADVDELEAHLRDRIDDLQAAGLAADEAFLIAVKRLGAVDELSREFAREHSERLWKQLVLDGGTDAPHRLPGLGVALLLGVGAGLAIKLPALWGAGDDPAFLLRNAALLVLPFLGAYFVWRHRPPLSATLAVAGVFAAVALAVNLYPAGGSGAEAAGLGQTALLSALHAPVLLWLMLGVLYASGAWRTARGRMDYIRFTGEWFVYLVLIALGGAVLAGLTIAVFAAVGVRADDIVAEWVLPCGAAGAVLVGAWLVEAKQSVIENIAPVLTRLFTPLFALLLVAFLATTIWQPNVIETDRELLIVFDLVLVVVLGLLLYATSAREPLAAPGWFDRLQAVLVGSAILVDVLVLVAMVARISTFGFTANKVASLGLNAILLVNLGWSLWLLIRALRGRGSFARLERWQTAYLPVYAGWAAAVVFLLPPLFGFA